jgi:hypothetical protein
MYGIFFEWKIENGERLKKKKIATTALPHYMISEKQMYFNKIVYLCTGKFKMNVHFDTYIQIRFLMKLIMVTQQQTATVNSLKRIFFVETGKTNGLGNKARTGGLIADVFVKYSGEYLQNSPEYSRNSPEYSQNSPEYFEYSPEYFIDDITRNKFNIYLKK